MNEIHEAKLLKVLAHHHGRARAISMRALYEAVFGGQLNDKINGSRKLRTLVTSLRREGIPICSTADSNGGGYYLVSGSSDLMDYAKRLRIAGLKKLAIAARLEKKSLPELLGQISVALAREPVSSEE
jgi:hypothetical protein